jgi:transcriptional regulator with XRE-family HTH domain
MGIEVNTAKLSLGDQNMDHTAPMGIGARIKELRERKGWSQAALARAAGVTQSVIAKLESDPTRKTHVLAEIARALGVEPGEIDPKFNPRPKLSPAEDKLAGRSADDWDRLIYAAVEEAFRLAGYRAPTAAKIAAEIQAAIDAPLRVPPGMTDADVVRRVVRWELEEVLRSEPRE